MHYSIRTLLIATLCASFSANAADRLPSFKGDPQGTAVTGLSAGGYMAVQYEVAFSASVAGAGIVGGGPYYCAAGVIFNTNVCMGKVPDKTPAVAGMVSAAQKFATEGKIDSLEHMKTQRVYVYSGTKDGTVKRPAVDAAVDFYKQVGVDGNALQYVNTVPSGHAMITADYGNECGTSDKPFINHCTMDGAGYDQAGAILQHIYGKLNPPAGELSSKVAVFNQKEFAVTNSRMSSDGYVYVPKTCASGSSCKLVIAFHGCAQSAKRAGDAFYAHAGFNRWADTNNLIVLYPQVDMSLLNPQGCWDWYGYTAANYATKAGPQMVAVKAMADRLLGVTK